MISFILMACAAITKAICDKLQFHFSTSIFSDSRFNENFWNPELSHKRKWKNGRKEDGEAFLFSSTLLVFLTDAWHLFQNIQWTLVALAIVKYEVIVRNHFIDFLILRIPIYMTIFHVFFTYIFHQTPNKK